VDLRQTWLHTTVSISWPLIDLFPFPDTFLSRTTGDGDVDDGGWLEVLRSIQDRGRSR
jgi:hypothetical protein